MLPGNRTQTCQAQVECPNMFGNVLKAGPNKFKPYLLGTSSRMCLEKKVCSFCFLSSSTTDGASSMTRALPFLVVDHSPEP